VISVPPGVRPGSVTGRLRHLLTELGDGGRTGAVHVDGHPGGVLYVVAGRITHAESPAVPGIGDRLIDSGRLSRRAWRLAYDAGHAQHRVGRLLVRGGHIGRTELACRVVAAITDATHALLQSDGADVRFVAGERHWLGVVAQVELGTFGQVTARRLLSTPVPRPGPRAVRCAAVAGRRSVTR
jgi:hypothetical protein